MTWKIVGRGNGSYAPQHPIVMALAEDREFAFDIVDALARKFPGQWFQAMSNDLNEPSGAIVRYRAQPERWQG